MMPLRHDEHSSIRDAGTRGAALPLANDCQGAARQQQSAIFGSWPAQKS
jgi:hypothetical protein